MSPSNEIVLIYVWTLDCGCTMGSTERAAVGGVAICPTHGTRQKVRKVHPVMAEASPKKEVPHDQQR